MTAVETVTYHAELRAADDGEGRTVAGIAVPYNEITYKAPRPERFMPGAFKRAVGQRAGRPVKVLRNHDGAAPVGLGTVTETAGGLLIEVRLADTAHGLEAAREVRAGMLDSFSVSFRAIRDRMAGGVREVLEAALHEVSLVAVPAYDGAQVLAVRAAAPVVVDMPPRPEVDMDALAAVRLVALR